MAKHSSVNRGKRQNKPLNPLKKVHSVYDPVNPRKLLSNETPLNLRRKGIKEARKAKYAAAKKERLKLAAKEEKLRLKQEKQAANANAAEKPRDVSASGTEPESKPIKEVEQ